MERRSPGAAKVVRSTIIALCLLLPLVGAGQHHDQQRPQGHDGTKPRPPPRLQPHEVETGSRAHSHFKDTVISNSASAIATLAPATLNHAVRAPPSAGLASKSAGSPSALSIARSLQDWEVEDFVLLATVDGTIHARDRKTGAARWALEVDRPMIETIYHRRNKSAENEARPEDDFLWIVEPSRDGGLYIYNPAPTPGLRKLELTVKKLVEELSPWAGEDPAVVYTAEKKNTLYTVDARSGRILKVFSSRGSTFNDNSSCRRVSGLEMPDEEECGSFGTLTLGRIEYTVDIHSRDMGYGIATLKYSEWGPNNRDSDLHGQYSTTLDKKYIYSRHDGSIFGFDHAQLDDRRKLYTQKFSSPVARIFDVARPSNSESKDASLIILPQPAGPTDNEEMGHGYEKHKNNIFINCTDAGGWYALSETTYPLVTGGADQAQCYREEWIQSVPAWDKTSLAEQRQALVGVHSISKHEPGSIKFPAISGPGEELSNESAFPVIANAPPSPSIQAISSSRLLGFAANNFVDISITLPILCLLLFFYVNRRTLGKLGRKMDIMERLPGVRGILMSPPPTPSVALHSFPKNVLDLETNTDKEQQVNLEGLEALPTDVVIIPPTLNKNEMDVFEAKDNPALPPPSEPEVPQSPQPKKKKTHRGNRGGAGRKKSRKESPQESEDKDDVERAVEDAKNVRRDHPIQPDIIEVNGKNHMTDVSGSPQQINSLVVTDTVLGHGSHGTIVFRGMFGNREVAVKRMLLEYFDIAVHEMGLLEESDDHPNVIRYFHKEQANDFLYIALELCPASLQDIVEKPQFEELASVSLANLPNALLQIAAGVQYLHSLKIVHRDLKPQNILVGAPKKTRLDPDGTKKPRLLISDFGLCKKLEGDQSSFRATTAHAAGTSGWRAPELLVDDDPNSHRLLSESSNDTSETGIIDTLSNRRATRAIDIFSLGCVFFYVLSGGNHPFDSDSVYMREANIVRGHYNLDQLKRLGDYSYEAIALIERMLDGDPRRRPDATTVMIHPFFWPAQKRLNFLVNVSDHFEAEPRDPPSTHLQMLESVGPEVLGTDFLRKLDKAFIDTLGKQRKYTGSKMLDLLRALRNKFNHYEDMPDNVKSHVGPLPTGYLSYWTTKFPLLLLQCYYVIIGCRLEEHSRFRNFFEPPEVV
ncbi:MAG: bifunctional endoribonuclease/protein kinase ire1 [Trizodia sp. TS-e1964]|nr:MAG: bifunctional endoribonuclease/protein kinase ire1 [Trizodia sp. TS-e1964]